MNRRGFFGALLALPAALKAVALAKPRPPQYDWKLLHATTTITARSQKDTPLNRKLDELAENGWQPLYYRGKQWWWRRG